jgi:hypothetical protein
MELIITPSVVPGMLRLAVGRVEANLEATLPWWGRSRRGRRPNRRSLRSCSGTHEAQLTQRVADMQTFFIIY